MGPLSLLLDHSRLIGRVHTLYSFAPAVDPHAADQHAVTIKTVAKDDERAAQIKGLVAGTLLFLPFLIGYFVTRGGL